MSWPIRKKKVFILSFSSLQLKPSQCLTFHIFPLSQFHQASAGGTALFCFLKMRFSPSIGPNSTKLPRNCATLEQMCITATSATVILGHPAMSSVLLKVSAHQARKAAHKSAALPSTWSLEIDLKLPDARNKESDAHCNPLPHKGSRSRNHLPRIG